jgi:hypothetical protein
MTEIPQDAIDVGAAALEAIYSLRYKGDGQRAIKQILTVLIEGGHIVTAQSLDIATEIAHQDGHQAGYYQGRAEAHDDNGVDVVALRAELAEAKAENERLTKDNERLRRVLREAQKSGRQKNQMIMKRSAAIEVYEDDLNRYETTLAEVTEQRDRAHEGERQLLADNQDLAEAKFELEARLNRTVRALHGCAEAFPTNAAIWEATDLLAEDWVDDVLQPNFTDTVNNPGTVNKP